MSTLPLLKTGRAAQYPLGRRTRQDIHTIQFVDGSEQRCATTQPLHEWTLKFHLIDEHELHEIEAFVTQQEGATGNFVFVDPATGTQYNNCSIAITPLQSTYHSPGRLSVVLSIRENPA